MSIRSAGSLSSPRFWKIWIKFGDFEIIPYGVQKKKGVAVNNRPFSVTLTWIFIILNAIFWLALGIMIAVNTHPELPVPSLQKGIMAFLSITMAGILMALFVFLRKGNRIAYYLTVALFIVVSLLTIFDDVGLSDIFVLVLNLIPIALLIKDRNWYLKFQPQANVSF